MSTARERVQEDAEDFAARHYLDLHGHRAGAEAGFIAGRTVTAEQIEQAARAAYEDDDVDAQGIRWNEAPPRARRVWRAAVIAGFTAARLIVEEEDA